MLYRVDAGGPEIDSTDGGPNWSEDDGAQPSPYRNQQSNTADYGPVTHLNANVPATTPAGIFDHERWSPTDSPPQSWDFPVPAGTHTEVRLYFANRYTGTSQAGSARLQRQPRRQHGAAQLRHRRPTPVTRRAS